MRGYRSHSKRPRERGVVITLVAVFMAFVVIVMAALAIDITTLYTARSEAQAAADGAALAAARTLANSGLASAEGYTPSFTAAAEALATTIALKVAESNPIGGNNLTSSGISISFKHENLYNPQVTVKVNAALPTFFLRIWSKQVAVSASATAEAFNPTGSEIPIAPVCVKPWILPNADPTRLPQQQYIFDRSTGAVVNPQLIGQGWNMVSQIPVGAPIFGDYYPAVVAEQPQPPPTELPVPANQTLPACSSNFNTDYQRAIAGCVPTPIACGQNKKLAIDTAPYENRDADTVTAVQCLIHSNGQPNDSDLLENYSKYTPPPFEFYGGNRNPFAPNEDILVSDSLVTIPVYNNANFSSAPSVSGVVIIGFLQAFLNPSASAMTSSSIQLTIINQVGCGRNATGTPVYGNGPSTVPVRLITPSGS